MGELVTMKEVKMGHYLLLAQDPVVVLLLELRLRLATGLACCRVVVLRRFSPAVAAAAAVEPPNDALVAR
jgi:hypothetical protein